MKEVELLWVPLQRLAALKDLATPPRGLSGVYIWGFQFSDLGPFVPYYIGRGTDVRDRLLDHLQRILAGDYIIWHRDYLPRFAEYKNENAYRDRNVVNYFPGRPDPSREGASLRERDVIEFITRRSEIRPHLDYMLDCFAFTYSRVPDEVPTSAAEKAVLAEVGLQRLEPRRSKACVLLPPRVRREPSWRVTRVAGV